jgi:hypothetical protein
LQTFVKYLSGKNNFLKKIIAIIILTSLFSHLLGSIGLNAWYNFNRESITSRHCENKDRPEMRCNGKCYLKKQLKKLNQNGDFPDGSDNKKASSDDYPIFIVPDYFTQIYPRLTGIDIRHWATRSFYGFQHENLVFHPPQHNA